MEALFLQYTWCWRTEAASDCRLDRHEAERDQQTRLLMNGAQGSRRVFVPRDNILNICFVEHKHYFFAYHCVLSVLCLRNFNNVAEIAKTTLCVPQITI